jgi:uncharacterized protein (DUF1800 family)
MTPREKIAHLLRRFGLGASQAELDLYEPMGPRKAFEVMLDFDAIPENFSVSPWSFAFGPDDQVNTEPGRFSAWWALKLAMTKRPVQEKLTVFWHDHFAISASKVASGPTMHQNNETLRKHAAGNFHTLLVEMTKDPAMLRWLDGDASIKGKPNENYAREVLELFTLGIGNYTEKDIQELSRAFTGWGLRQALAFRGQPAQIKKSLLEALEMDLPLVASTYCEGLHDDAPKTILGKTANFDTESALAHIVSLPQTARYVSTKLWEYFAYPNPEPKIVDRLAKAFAASKYEIKPVLRAIYDSPEFWGEKCVRQQVKSPLDFTVALVRQLDLTQRIKESPQEMAMMSGSMPMSSPITPSLAGVAQLVASQMGRQGMRLYYPPDVAGWEWGEAWVSPAMMAERMRFAAALVGRGRQGVVEHLRGMLSETGQTSDAVVEGFARIFDVSVPPERRALLVEAVDKAGGAKALERGNTAAPGFEAPARLVFGMPEFQLC